MSYTRMWENNISGLDALTEMFNMSYTDIEYYVGELILC